MPPFLKSGIFADNYDEAKDEAILRANQRIKASTVQAVDATTIGYTTCFKTSDNVRFANGKISYALLPVYVFSTNYNGKIYTFAMNGQTGKFSGDLPADSKLTMKYALTSFLISFVVIALLMIFLVK